MKIITCGKAIRIRQQHPVSRLFPFCTGKYRWHGSIGAYTDREVRDTPGVLAVFAERRKDSLGSYVRLMSITLNRCSVARKTSMTGRAQIPLWMRSCS